jgi:hypothetical protein
VQEIETIAAMQNPPIRNLQITHAYHRLSASFAAVTGAGANWCTFAVWASRQAGKTIRGEDLLLTIGRALQKPPKVTSFATSAWRRVFLAALEQPDTRRSRVLRILAEGAFARASVAVARGNLKVFEEIAREFARFLPLCGTGRVEPQALATFASELKPGDPPDGQEYLRRAFSHYARALEVTDSQVRAELLLLANLEIGLHEQTRLQPEILEALEAPFEATMELGRRLLLVIAPGSRGWRGLFRAPAAALVGGMGRTAQLGLRSLLRHLITDSLMTLGVAGENIHLGRDLRGDFPDSLREPVDSELTELLKRFEAAADDPDGAGADDWSVLQERMTLICRLFRLRHETASLLQAPFTPEQVLAFQAGRLPSGGL